MITIIVTAVLVLAVLLFGLFIGLEIVQLAKKDVHFTELLPETGKMVKMGGSITRILFNSQYGHYGKSGNWKVGSQTFLGFGKRIFFGISPFYEIFKFSVSWGEYSQTEENGRVCPLVTIRRIEGDSFKRFYTHAVMVSGSEMAKEGSQDEGDTSTTRINAVMLVTFEVTNIIDAVFRIPPEGISFSQANAALQGAFNDYIRGRRWDEFRKEYKLSPDSPFARHVLAEANPILKTLGIGIRATVVELKYYDLTPSIENEALAESQTLLLVAQNKGAAEVALATKEKEAVRIRAEGEAEALRAKAQGKRDALEAIGKVPGIDIGAYANLELVGQTELRVYGPTNVVPVVNTSD